MRSYFLYTLRSTGLTCHEVSGTGQQALGARPLGVGRQVEPELEYLHALGRQHGLEAPDGDRLRLDVVWLGFLRAASRISGVYQEPKTMPVLPLGGRSFQ